MEELGRQPLFFVLGALVVLLITDWHTVWGAAAAIMFLVWIGFSHWAARQISHPR
jgi:hypothetical protein